MKFFGRIEIPGILVYGCMVCFGLLFIFIGILLSYDNILFKKKAMHFEGEVVDVFTKSDKGEIKYLLKVYIQSLTTSSQSEYVLERDAPKNDYKRGDKISILYDAQNQKCMINSFSSILTPGKNAIICGLILSICGGSAILFIFLRPDQNEILEM